ncbi:META domain-containing protein [Rhodovulum steppense]|uniref:Putative lipoprotein YbaY n=1 Tax=Rhodovulum steppense TaxID=540251 RepID=A0A4R1YMA9_9RHOB|nr:META domain-containing protein [Rhodovulum steppense]TCM78373.1 putative lipoprotein YbaY [Rhodovulum steppense]
MADTLTGRAMIDTRMALPTGLTFEAVIEDISRADAPATVIGRTVIENPGQPPIDFAIDYDPADLRPQAIYSLRATIRRGDALMFTTDTITRVLTDGATGPVEVRLRPVARSSGASPAPVGAHGLSLPASFTGILPCADCEGIRHHLDLWPDQVYHMRREWLGRPEGPLRRDEVGRWYADPARGAIVLYGASEMPLFWEVRRPGRLRQMDMAGNPITSDLPYELTSDGTLSPTDLDTLFLSGEVLIGPEGPALRECLTGRVYPVETEGAFADLAAAVEAQRESEATPLLVSLEARITQPHPGLAPQFPRLTVLRFVRAFPGESCTRPEPTAELANTYWRIDSLMGEDLPPVDGRREPHLVLLDAPEARFRATVGCNQLIGRYERAGDRLTFAAGASTMMACPPPLDALERQLSEVLKATRRIRLEGERLDLLGDDGAVLAELRAVYLR